MPVNDYANSSALLRGTASRGVVNTTTQPMDFVQFLASRGLLVPVTDPRVGGPEPVTISLVTGNGSTAEVFAEGQALPGGARRSFVNMTLGAIYVREKVVVTGRVLDIAAANGFVGEDLYAAEIANATANVMALLDVRLTGTVVNAGLASIIDDVALYGGVDPATYATHASLDSAVGGAQTAATLADHYESATSNPYNGRPSVILANSNQITNYTNLGSLAGGTAVTRIMSPTPGYDIGVAPSVASYNGIPWVRITNLANSVTIWVDPADYLLAVQRDVKFEPLAKQADDEVGVVSIGVIPIVKRRRSHSKQSGLTP